MLFRASRGDLLAVLVLIALVLACFARLVAEPGALIVDGARASVDHAQHDDFRPPGNDLTFFYLPRHAHVANEVWRDGRLPRWDTQGFGGRPLVGNPQAGLFYPPVWLAWWARSPAALGWLTLAHLMWGAIGLHILMRSMGTCRRASMVAGGCFALSPYLLAQVFEGHYPHVWAACWYPWALDSYRRLRAGQVSSVFILALILAFMFMTGHAQEWYYGTLVLSAWAAWDLRGRLVRRDLRAAILLGVSWIATVGLSLGLVSVELVPDLAAQHWTLRGSRFAVAKVSHYQLQFLNLFQLLEPRALGGPSDFLGKDNYWETVLGIGLVPLVLAVVAVARHPKRGLTRGWLVLVAGAIVFAAGRKLGLFTMLFEVIPGMNRFRVPARSLFLAVLGGAVLAGLGVETLTRHAFGHDDWRNLSRWFRNGVVAVVSGLALLLPFAAGGPERTLERPERPMSLREIRTFLRSDRTGPYAGAMAAATVLGSFPFWWAIGGAAGVFAIGIRRPDRRTVCGLALGLVGLTELLAHGHALIRVTPADRFLGDDPVSKAIARSDDRSSPPIRIRARDTLYSDLRASTHGLEKINVNDSFQLQHAADLYETLYPLLYVIPPANPLDPMSAVVHETKRALRQKVLDLWGVEYLVSDHVEADAPWPFLAEGRLDGSPFDLHRNPTALPRAYVVPRAEPVDEDLSSVRAAVRGFDPHLAVLMSRDPLPPSELRQPFTAATWSRHGSDRRIVSVATEAPGLLVVAETWMPGWKARLDGRPVPLLRGNHAQQVIALPSAGRHMVELSYEAPGLPQGFAVTVASILVCVVGGVGSRLRERGGNAISRHPLQPHAMSLNLVRPNRAAFGATTRESGWP